MRYLTKISFLGKKKLGPRTNRWILLHESGKGWTDYAKTNFPDPRKTHDARINLPTIYLDGHYPRYYIKTHQASELYSPSGNVYYNPDNNIALFIFPYTLSGIIKQGTDEQYILDNLEPSIERYKNKSHIIERSFEELLNKL